MANVIRFDLMSGIKKDIAELPEKMLEAAFEELDAHSRNKNLKNFEKKLKCDYTRAFLQIKRDRPF